MLISETMSKHNLKWFEEYASYASILQPLTQSEWKELAKLLHDINQFVESFSELAKRL